MLVAVGGPPHDIPASIVVQAFVRPEGRTARVLVRVPMAAMRDIEFPLRDGGLLDLPRADAVAARRGRAVARERTSRSAKATRRSARRALAAVRAYRSRPTAPSPHTNPRWRASPVRRLPPGTALFWNQALLDVLLRISDRVGPIDVLDPAVAGAPRRGAS